jgi:hypothetical protein
MTIIVANTVLANISLSHSLQCPLGGGFWTTVSGAANCTDDDQPLCTCTPTLHLKFEDGTVIDVSVGREFIDSPLFTVVNAIAVQGKFRETAGKQA